MLKKSDSVEDFVFVDNAKKINGRMLFKLQHCSNLTRLVLKNSH